MNSLRMLTGVGYDVEATDTGKPKRLIWLIYSKCVADRMFLVDLSSLAST